jgi:hypothetical protein
MTGIEWETGSAATKQQPIANKYMTSAFTAIEHSSQRRETLPIYVCSALNDKEKDRGISASSCIDTR